MEQYPLIKVFVGSDKLIYSMAYAYSDKEMSQRLCEFVSDYPGFAEAAVKIKYELLPRKNGKVDMDTLKDIHDWNLRKTDELLEIMHQDSEGVLGMTVTSIGLPSAEVAVIALTVVCVTLVMLPPLNHQLVLLLKSQTVG